MYADLAILVKRIVAKLYKKFLTFTLHGVSSSISFIDGGEEEIVDEYQDNEEGRHVDMNIRSTLKERPFTSHLYSEACHRTPRDTNLLNLNCQLLIFIISFYHHIFMILYNICYITNLNDL